MGNPGRLTEVIKEVFQEIFLKTKKRNQKELQSYNSKLFGSGAYDYLYHFLMKSFKPFRNIVFLTPFITILSYNDARVVVVAHFLIGLRDPNDKHVFVKFSPSIKKILIFLC